MRSENGLDHLPPWLAWGSIAATGAYSPSELGLMAAPLLLAGLAQARQWSLLRWQRLLELAALAGFLAQVLARTGLLPTLVNTLFLLCAVRLALPRTLPQRRQLLLMGFLLFLTTAISSSELNFLLWSLLWVLGTAALLLQQSWGKSQLLRQGPLQPPPYRLLLPWTALVVVLAAGFFVILPRLRLGLRGLPVGVQGTKQVQAGLSEVLDLSGSGPIENNRELALRLLPTPALRPGQQPGFARAAALLRCFVLEELDGQRWTLAGNTPPRSSLAWNGSAPRQRPLAAQVFLAPTLRGVLPLPYGPGELEAPAGEQLLSGHGGAVRLAAPVQGIAWLQMAWTPANLQQEPAPAGLRLAQRTAPGLNTGAALRASLRLVPEQLPAQALAERLSAALCGWRYTLDNPSGATSNPLADFLEHSHAGHCEYFASALAFMLRHRGVPSRVAIGYRLGAWNAEGGYFLVTQGEAHSWVEYYDAEAGGWRVADPTPSAPNTALAAGRLGAALSRWADAVRFQWDRHVLHFSGQDQITGLDWVQARALALSHWQPRRPSRDVLLGAGALLLLAGAARAGLGQGRRSPRSPGGGQPGLIRELTPLVRKLRKRLPPLAGETARGWLARLALAEPLRAAALEALAQEADAVAYGQKAPANLKALARAEARAWKR